MSRVLIIDDDPIHQRITQILIARDNIFDEFISYTQAGKALSLRKEKLKWPDNLPDVILLDLNMPGVDGWDFLELFATIELELKTVIRIFIVTSSVNEKDRIRSMVFSSVKGFISKPLSTDIIRSTR